MIPNDAIIHSCILHRKTKNPYFSSTGCPGSLKYKDNPLRLFARTWKMKDP